jgi:hypothetical protein
VGVGDTATTGPHDFGVAGSKGGPRFRAPGEVLTLPNLTSLNRSYFNAAPLRGERSSDLGVGASVVGTGTFVHVSIGVAILDVRANAGRSGHRLQPIILAGCPFYWWSEPAAMGRTGRTSEERAAVVHRLP